MNGAFESTAQLANSYPYEQFAICGFKCGFNVD